MKELPEGWKWERLQNICTIHQGYGFPKDFQGLSDGKYPFYKVGDISKNVKAGHKFLELCDNFINEETIQRLKAKPYPINTIVFAKIGEALKLNRRAILKVPAIVDNNAIGIKAKNETCNDLFLFYFLTTIKLEDYSRATTVPSVRKSDIEEIPIPFPSKLIQQAIVSKIEELFSEIDKGIEQLKTARQQLKTYRQAVLKWAFVNDTFDDFKINEIVEKTQIGPFGTQLHKEDYIENGIPLINPMHIQEGKIIADYSYSIKEEKRDSLPNYILQEGDVVMGRRGEMGRCGLVSKNEDGWFCGTGSLYFRPKKAKVNSTFLYYYLSSKPVKKYLEENAGGTTMANLNLKIVNDIPISLPSIEDQNQIVQEIESRLSVADKMEESIIQSLQQAEVLRQSILKKAFEGKLV